ncbi:AAA family ATPase, partial [Streptococcus pyogenes]
VNRKNRLAELRKTLLSSKNELEKKKNVLKNLSIGNEVIYNELPLRADSDFAFNNESIVFDDELSNESLNIYLSEIAKLQEFRNSFSPKDYF